VDQRTRYRPRIADVAREAGVSKTAVSFAFNRPSRLAPATALRIRTVAENLGYRPDPVARMLTQRRTWTLGVMTPQALAVVFSNPFFAMFSEGVALAAEHEGYALDFVSPLRGSLTRAIERAMVDGVIAVGVAPDSAEVRQLRASRIPVVMIDSSPLTDMATIEIDDESGAFLAAKHLVELGHRDILIVGIESTPATPPAPDGIGGRRLRGYQRGLALAGIDTTSANSVVGSSTVEGGIAALRRSWEDGLRPTAALVMSDAMAIGVLRAARDVGLSVPEDLSVVGFDDIEMSRHTCPPLTTVHQPIRIKGQTAVRMLLSMIDGGDGHPAPVVLQTRLIVRHSTARPRDGDARR